MQCLQDKYITSVIVIIEIMEDINVKILTILLRKKFLLGGNLYLVILELILSLNRIYLL